MYTSRTYVIMLLVGIEIIVVRTHLLSTTTMYNDRI